MSTNLDFTPKVPHELLHKAMTGQMTDADWDRAVRECCPTTFKTLQEHAGVTVT